MWDAIIFHLDPSMNFFFKFPLTEFDFGDNIIPSVKREECIQFYKTRDFFPVIQLLY